MGGWTFRRSFVSNGLPLLDYEDDRPQEQDEHHQTADARAQYQAHVLGVLRHLQRVLGILTGSWTMEKKLGKQREGDTVRSNLKQCVVVTDATWT